jgi:hypothetical protein
VLFVRPPAALEPEREGERRRKIIGRGQRQAVSGVWDQASVVGGWRTKQEYRRDHPRETRG